MVCNYIFLLKESNLKHLLCSSTTWNTRVQLCVLPRLPQSWTRYGHNIHWVQPSSGREVPGGNWSHSRMSVTQNDNGGRKRLSWTLQNKCMAFGCIFFQVKPISRFSLSIIIVPGSHWENMFQAIGAFFPRQDFPNHALYPVNWYEQVLLEKISQLITWSDVVEFI